MEVCSVSLQKKKKDKIFFLKFLLYPHKMHMWLKCLTTWCKKHLIYLINKLPQKYVTGHTKSLFSEN